ncbi:ABC transporter permease [Tenacibaculum jejuense]|uniref:Probable ABC-type transport system, permease component. nitrate/sulfonate/bicarbonate transporter n=1 Tax=Tenacibaculum jejuense TaxID=584609 RepID=A0A238UCT6_9FLAO|nr:ABC transporter permease [Tenacibaculum jejuense]SNR16284.1 Probable ABC-type transport system, permease component. nitrate/sulfonate/bicarbonate transporter [Tenacibaculum jejuense]
MKQSVTVNQPAEAKWQKVIKTLFSKVSVKKPSFNLLSTLKKVGIPFASIVVFIGIWHLGAEGLRQREINYRVEKTLADQGEAAAAALKSCFASGDATCQTNTLPSPTMVWASVMTLINDHFIILEDKKAFRDKTASLNEKIKVFNKENAALISAGKVAKKELIEYTGRASFIDIVLTSLKTVFAGFLLAFFIAVPIGIVIGLSDKLRNAFNWFIQIFKPVSPVVWYLLVFMIVKTLLIGTSTDNSFVISFISVGLCAMWATLVNTAVGVSTVDKDYINVAKVLKLGPLQKVFKVILPSSLPLIFTGLRITLSVAWMVLIAIELLAQSPGLGLFVWEEFQNGANDSNSKIIVAMFVIGIIGFLLDRFMLTIQNMVSFNKSEGI